MEGGIDKGAEREAGGWRGMGRNQIWRARAVFLRVQSDALRVAGEDEELQEDTKHK